jgi:hypothetical protein
VRCAFEGEALPPHDRREVSAVELGDGYGPRVAESGIGLITNMAGSVPYEKPTLKGK